MNVIYIFCCRYKVCKGSFKNIFFKLIWVNNLDLIVYILLFMFYYMVNWIKCNMFIGIKSNMFCIFYFFVGFFLFCLNNMRGVEFIYWYMRWLWFGVWGMVFFFVCLFVFMDVVVSSVINMEFINIYEFVIIYNYCVMCGIYMVV